MSTETSPNQNKTLKDKVNRGLAYIGIGAALAGVLAEGAQASATRGATANTASHIDKKPKPRKYIDESQIPLEAAKSLRSMHERWNGVVILTAPKRKNETIGLLASPDTFRLTEDPDLSLGWGSKGVIRLINPGLVKVDGITYLVAFSSNLPGTYGFVDIEAAKEAGVIMTYAYKTSAPKPEPYKIGGVMSASAHNLPMADGLDIVPNEKGGFIYDIAPPVQSPTDNRADLALKPSNILPHL